MKGLSRIHRFHGSFHGDLTIFGGSPITNIGKKHENMLDFNGLKLLLMFVAHKFSMSVRRD